MNIHKSNIWMNVLNRQINKQNITSIPEPLPHSPFSNYSVPSTRITICRLLIQWKGLFVFKLYINVLYVSGFFCSPLCFWDLSVSDFDPIPLRNYMFSDCPNSPHSTLPRLIFFRSPLATVFFPQNFLGLLPSLHNMEPQLLLYPPQRDWTEAPRCRILGSSTYTDYNVNLQSISSWY